MATPRKPKSKGTGLNREHWLTEAIERVWPVMVERIPELPGRPEVRVSCGWPSKTPSKTLGQCFTTTSAGDGASQIFISPVLHEPVPVLGTLIHELIHAVDDCKSGHKGPFAKMAKAVGLTGKMTATVPGEELAAILNGIAEELPEYPHKGVTYTRKSGAGSRLLKAGCPECGYTIRVTAKWIAFGLPTCPCGTEMMESA